MPPSLPRCDRRLQSPVSVSVPRPRLPVNPGNPKHTRYGTLFLGPHVRGAISLLDNVTNTRHNTSLFPTVVGPVCDTLICLAPSCWLLASAYHHMSQLHTR